MCKKRGGMRSSPLFEVPLAAERWPLEPLSDLDSTRPTNFCWFLWYLEKNPKLFPLLLIEWNQGRFTFQQKVMVENLVRHSSSKWESCWHVNSSVGLYIWVAFGVWIASRSEHCHRELRVTLSYQLWDRVHWCHPPYEKVHYNFTTLQCQLRENFPFAQFFNPPLATQ